LTSAFFTGKKDHEKVLYFEKTEVHPGKADLGNHRRSNADKGRHRSQNKLIDRVADDNMIDATKQ